VTDLLVCFRLVALERLLLRDDSICLSSRLVVELLQASWHRGTTCNL